MNNKIVKNLKLLCKEDSMTILDMKFNKVNYLEIKE
jgi:hypothetical protein